MKLYTPGPTNLHRKVVASFNETPPYFASKKFGMIVEDLQLGIRHELGLPDNSGYVLIGTGSGTAGMEAAVRNLVNFTKSTLVMSCGKYGQSFHQMCLRAGAVIAKMYEDPSGYPLPSEDFRNLLTSTKPDVVFLTYIETTTGIKSPVHEYAAIVRNDFPRALIVLDAVAKTKLDVLDSSYFDVIISASQKAVGGPPGLFFMYVSDRVEPLKSAPFYFDFNIERSRIDKKQTSHTPADRVFLATNTAVKIVDVGLKRRRDFAREYFREWISVPERMSPSGIVVLNADGRAQQIKKHLKHVHRILIATGLREQSRDLIRIRTFGKDFFNAEFERHMGYIKEALNDVEG